MSFIFQSCSQEDTARVTIDLDSGGLALQSKGPGYIDRILNFITMSHDADAAPAGITSYTLTVTGPGMGTITEEYPDDTTRITLDIPSGKERAITLTADLDPSVVVNFKSYTGSAYLDLKSGEVRRISLNMYPSETKIVIPDLLRNRVIQIDDMNGTNWKALTGGNLSGISLYGTAVKSITPYDIAYDTQGRIYISNYESGSYTNLYRIDSIPASGTITAHEIVSGKDVAYIQWLAMDMKNSILYFTNFNQSSGQSALYKYGLNGAGLTQTPLMTFASGSGKIYGINVDSEGMLYIVYSNNGTVNMVAKYNPASFSAPVATFNFNSHYGVNTYYPRDVIVKGNDVFVAVAGNIAAAREIVLFDTNLQYVDSYGTAGTGTDKGQFFGPCQFAAILNRKLYIIDDGDYDFNYMNWYDKLVAMDDIDGTNWEVYNAGTCLGDDGLHNNTNRFWFYYNC